MYQYSYQKSAISLIMLRLDYIQTIISWNFPSEISDMRKVQHFLVVYVTVSR
jgi:hypothetical protein